MEKKFYITTAIDYINGLPHIGTAYEKITADCIARAKRLLGYDVRFCMGTDEHSINVKKKALEEGLDPKTFCDMMAPKFEEIWKKLNISYDDFVRTTEPRHKLAVTELFKRIQAAGDIYTAEYKGWYCEGCEAFIQEKELTEGKCPHHLKEPSWIEETNYFFRLSKYADPLLEHISKNPDCIQPESRKNEILQLIRGGLEDISVSRSGFDWGIPLPDDSEHVVYVWFDALINYISSLGFGGEDDFLFKKYWPADVHIIGKDITRFHCVIWPAMLMSAGVTVPKSVFGHGFIYHSGERMSKSLGNVVSPLDVVDRYGADPLRIFLLKEVVYGQDGDFTFDRFIERYNSDLANDLGNLLSRTSNMIEKYLDGVFPEDVTLPEDAISHQIGTVAKDWGMLIEKFNLSGACERVWDLIRASNRRIEEKAPWKMAKDPSLKNELTGVLFDLASVIGVVAVLLKPYMPSTSESILKSFAFEGNNESVVSGSFPKPPINRKINKTDALFPRIDNSAVKAEKKQDKLSVIKESQMSDDDFIAIEDLKKVDIRVGTVEKAERVDGSEKLLRLKIDDGDCGRTILAGIAKYFTPEEMTGRQVVFVANLKPRKMMGEISQGMVLAAVDDDKLTVLGVSASVANGTRVS